MGAGQAGSGLVIRYEVQIGPRAIKQLAKVDVRDRERVRGVLLALGADPRPPAAKKLVDSVLWRVRVGDYRIVYTIEDAKLLVVVVRVGHRREVYDR